MKSSDVTIQMKALCLYFHMMLFKILYKIWKFGRTLPLATFGSERVNPSVPEQERMPRVNDGV